MAQRKAASDGVETTSIGKALALLRLVASRNPQGLNLTSVARRSGLSTSTAHRLLQSLASANFLSFDPYSKQYFLGADALDLARAAGLGSLDEARRIAFQSVIDRIAAETGDTAYLSVRDGASSVCIARAQGSFPVAMNTLHVGARRPLGAGAGSMALLAADAPEAAADIVHANRENYTRYGALTASRVAGAIAAARRAGYAFNNSMIIEGVGAIGVPIYRSGEGLVAAISVAAIVTRLRAPRRRELLATIRREAAEAGFNAEGKDSAADTVLPAGRDQVA